MIVLNWLHYCDCIVRMDNKRVLSKYVRFFSYFCLLSEYRMLKYIKHQRKSTKWFLGTDFFKGYVFVFLKSIWKLEPWPHMVLDRMHTYQNTRLDKNYKLTVTDCKDELFFSQKKVKTFWTCNKMLRFLYNNYL